MLSIIKQVFPVLLLFRESLATKHLLLNDEPCLVRSILIDMNPIDLKHYPGGGILNLTSPPPSPSLHILRRSNLILI